MEKRRLSPRIRNKTFCFFQTSLYLNVFNKTYHSLIVPSHVCVMCIYNHSVQKRLDSNGIEPCPKKCFTYIKMYAALKYVLIRTPLLEIRTRTVIKKHILEEPKG